MKNGKHAAPRGMKRSLVLVVSLLALLLVVAGGTLAWLTAQDSVSNTFTPAHVTCNVDAAVIIGLKTLRLKKSQKHAAF